MNDRKVQPVSFSLTDPFEKDLWEYAIKKGFSKYVKRLIYRDKEGMFTNPSVYVEQNDTPRKKAVVASFL